MSERKLMRAVEVERSVLGSMLVDREALDAGIELLQETSFYSSQNQLVFAGILAVVQSGATPDLITVSDQLARTEDLDLVGQDYLSELVSTVATTSNIAHLCERLESCRKVRELAATASWLGEATNDPSADARALVDETEGRIYAINNIETVERWYHPSEILPEILADMERCQTTGEAAGLPTGYLELDTQTTGLQNGDLVILAGRPSMGKTAFALCVALNVVKANPEGTVAFFSMEMSRKQIVQRILCADAGIEMKRLRSPQMTKSERQRVMESFHRIKSMNIEIDDSGLLTPMQQRSKLRRLSRKKKMVLGVCDYLQLMKDSQKHTNRQSEITAISRQLKCIAKEFEIPYIVLSQLSRLCEQRGKDKRPMLSDLRESGAIEQDADLVMACYRDEFYNRDSTDKGVAEILVLKQRNGPIGRTKLAFFGPHMRFDNLTSDPEPRMTDVSQEW